MYAARLRQELLDKGFTEVSSSTATHERVRVQRMGVEVPGGTIYVSSWRWWLVRIQSWNVWLSHRCLTPS
jgi:hypothetical protein